VAWGVVLPAAAICRREDLLMFYSTHSETAELCFYHKVFRWFDVVTSNLYRRLILITAFPAGVSA
jgi:hypothetical protein